MIYPNLMGWEFAAVVLAFVASGLIRGFNGGAGANFITAPVLAFLIGPREAVPIIIFLNLISNIQVMPSALPNTDWKRMLPIGLSASVMAPVGVWILFAIEEELMRRIVAGTSIMLSLILLWLALPWASRDCCASRCRRPRGLVTGSVSMGGPYILSLSYVRTWRRGIPTRELSCIWAYGSNRCGLIICVCGFDYARYPFNGGYSFRTLYAGVLDRNAPIH